MAQKSPQNPKEHLQQLNILHLALLGGQLMVAAVIVFLIKGKDGEDTPAVSTLGDLDPMVFVAIAIFIAGVGASFFIYKKRKAEGAALTGSLMEKLAHYRQSFVMRAALLEGPNLIMVILYFLLQGNLVLMILFAIGVVLFLMIRPTAGKIIEDYQLSGSEQSDLRNSTL